MVMKSAEQKLQSQASKPMLSPSSSTSTSKSSSSSSSCKKKFKGVRMRSWGSWVSEIRAPNQKTRIWLGSYSTPEAAARAYDAALLCLKGSSANLNFPHLSNTSSYSNDTLMSPKSIQRVAAAAANTFVEQQQQQQHLNVSSSSSLSSSSSSSMTSSPSMSSSPSPSNLQQQLIDDSISLAPPGFDSNMDVTYGMIAGDNVSSSMVMLNDPWFDFSPKYLDMMNGVFFDPSMSMDDFHEEGDLTLWSF